MHSKSILLVAILVAVSGFTAYGSAPDHLEWFGFFDYEPWSMEGWNNFSWIEDLTYLNEGGERGIAGFIDVRHVFCIETWAPGGGSWQGWGLRDDWQQSWKTFSDLIAPMVASGHIKGFTLLDEPVWTGVSVVELATMADAIKADFPDTIIYVVEAQGPFINGENYLGQPVNYDPVPANIDWIGFDMYYVGAATVRSSYETYLYPKMQSHQRAILIPEAFGSVAHPTKSLEDWDNEMLDYAQAYYA